jgi:hypothetical protein
MEKMKNFHRLVVNPFEQLADELVAILEVEVQKLGQFLDVEARLQITSV